MRASTPPITDARGHTLAGSIAALEALDLGGVRQSVLIRGRDARNPVLLFLHGGPGTSELGMLRTWNLPALEERYTVAVWDQRGAGRSFAARHPRSGMTVRQILADALELSELLGRRFGQRRIFLAGHSWGSLLGVLAVARRPDLFHAWIGFGQAAHVLEGERASYDWTLAEARRRGDRRAVARLERIGRPPYDGDVRGKVVAQRTILARYGGEVHGNPRGGVMIVLGALLRTPEYSWRDRLSCFPGIFGSMRLLWPQMMELDLFTQAPRLEVPAYFLLGRHDMEAPSGVAARYAEALVPPRKEVVWFERSAHFVNVEEAEAFNAFFAGRLPRELPSAWQPGATLLPA